MTYRVGIFAALILTLIVGCRNQPQSSEVPPAAPREFRAAWVATVANIDWPTKPGLSTADQQAEAIGILDRRRELNMNAIVLQVRTTCDAFYDSRLEPWSYYLTAEQGKAPDPYYDPLKFWIEESHKRGIELHAWFNPYRARHNGASYESPASHVSKSRPVIVREFNKWQWLDPAEPGAQDQTFDVFMDVVRRYDVDGIHIDDYFYPYPEYLKNADFPDTDQWSKYQSSGGKLSRADWRRDNVNKLIERVYRGTKQRKQWVKFGISPFGLARKGHPPGTEKGFDQYEKLYADAELWLRNGWLDYFTPQLYWKLNHESVPYEPLLKWWIKENTMKRHLWPGQFTSKLGEEPRPSTSTTSPTTAPTVWEPKDITDQIDVTRKYDMATGNVHFSMKAFVHDWKGINKALTDGPYKEPALIPASPWLDSRPPARPSLSISRDGSKVAIDLGQPWFSEKPAVYAVWIKYGQTWKLRIEPADQRTMEISDDASLGPVTVVSASAVDRCGNESVRNVQDVPSAIAKRAR